MKFRIQNFIIIFIMMVLAACGLIYEYLISHYAAMVIGSVDTAIYGIIGIMLLSMGIGSAVVEKKIKDKFTGFVILEIIVGTVGATSTLTIAVVVAASYSLPSMLAEFYGMDYNMEIFKGVLHWSQNFAYWAPYIVAFIIGFLIGVEIPLMSSIREKLFKNNGDDLSDNFSTMYGADYIGAALGAVVWVIFMLRIDSSHAAGYTAAINLTIGVIFLAFFWKDIKYKAGVLTLKAISITIVGLVIFHGTDFHNILENMMYEDQVVYSTNTKYQHLTVTNRKTKEGEVNTLFINGKTQFSSNDEKWYHEMLVFPAMSISREHDNILVIGGGDGMAVREILKWNPKNITVMDLDSGMIDLFKNPKVINGKVVNQMLIDENKGSFSDERVNIIIGDAFNSLDSFIFNGIKFDTVIIDLPDPSHPNLNKLYSNVFYKKVRLVMEDGAALEIQSTSPYHAKKVFSCIRVTLKNAGFNNVIGIHTNIPSFSEWGWNIAIKDSNGNTDTLNLLKNVKLSVKSEWITSELIAASTVFSKNFFKGEEQINVNYLDSFTIYDYYQNDWEIDKGIGIYGNS